MNETVMIDTPDEFTVKAIMLLKEYLRKMLKLKEQIRGLWIVDQSSPLKYGSKTKNMLITEYNNISDKKQRVIPAIMQLNQQVSGMIDQGKLRPLARAELQIRLAELESALSEIDSWLKLSRTGQENYRPLFSAYNTRF